MNPIIWNDTELLNNGSFIYDLDENSTVKKSESKSLNMIDLVYIIYYE